MSPGADHGARAHRPDRSGSRAECQVPKCYVLNVAALASRSDPERLSVVASATYSERPCTLLCRLVLQREGILPAAHMYAARRRLISGSKTST